MQVDLITLDFSKAFDKVAHRRLLSKLAYYGIQNSILNWILAFLSNRSQSVCVNGTKSQAVPVTSGVPQGTVLGPALFLLYINDIATEISSTMRLFADDSILYREINNDNDRAMLQNDIDKLVAWSEKWQMSFNVSKCTVMTITNKRNPIHANYLMDSLPLNRVFSQDYLGVTISTNLNWAQHVSKVSKKSSKSLGLLQRTLHNCPENVKSVAYKALVRPKLEYACAAWNPYRSKDIYKLERIQRQAARFVNGDYKRTSSVTDMLTSLGWESLEARRQKSQSVMLYKIINNLVSIPLPEDVYYSEHGRTLRNCSSENPTLHVPLSKVDAHYYSFFPRTIRTWNTLPCTITQLPTLETFKTNIPFPV
jgi:hypothetical protein